MRKKILIVLSSLITIWLLIIVLKMIQNKEELTSEKKDWSSYIVSQEHGQTRPLFQKVMKKYFYQKDPNENTQYRAVNFGSGSAIEDIELINKGWEVLSIDSCLMSSKILDSKSKDAIGKSIFFLGDFNDVKLTKEYNLIMSFYALPFGKKQDLDKLLKNINLHIKPDGIFVANFFGNDHTFVKNKSAYGLSQKELFAKFLDNGFKIIEFKNKAYKAEAFSSEGKKVNWDVLEVIAKRQK